MPSHSGHVPVLHSSRCQPDSVLPRQQPAADADAAVAMYCQYYDVLAAAGHTADMRAVKAC